MALDAALELKEILAQYDLGELVDLEKNERGFVNTAFAIDTVQNGEHRRFFLRKYKRGIKEEELQFEHSLIDHLVETGACPAARIYRTRLGESYFHHFEEPEDTEGVFYTIFDFLPGEDRYTWVDPVLTERELAESAVVLGRFHNAVSDLAPRGRRAEPKIIELLPVIAATWSACPGKSKGTVFDDCVLENLALVGKNIQDTRSRLNEPAARRLPELVIHCDYHPGNLKFTGEQVTALFDFDWSKIDLRLFDVALALWYFCTSWQGPEDGRFRLDWASVFLHAYQDYLHEETGAGPLSPDEVRYLPILINASNLYVLNWTILDFYAKDVDPEEYLVFLKHNVNFTHWFEDPANRQALEALAASLLS